MARINDEILNCVFYVYPSGEQALKNQEAGGTGFLVSVPSEINSEVFHYYAVTNKHVISEKETRGIRLKTEEGERPFEISPFDWIFHPNGDDLAIFPLNSLRIDDSPYDIEKLKHTAVPVDIFITKENYGDHNLGPGNDIYMIGRFMSAGAKQSNTPLVRFGNISMLSCEKIKNQHTGGEQQSFLVEMRSVSGCSGSPVFVKAITARFANGVIAISEGLKLLLLGVDWGHFPIYDPVGRFEGKNFRPNNNCVAQSHKAEAGVVPAWKLYELLYLEKFVDERKKQENLITE